MSDADNLLDFFSQKKEVANNKPIANTNKQAPKSNLTKFKLDPPPETPGKNTSRTVKKVSKTPDKISLNIHLVHDNKWDQFIKENEITIKFDRIGVAKTFKSDRGFCKCMLSKIIADEYDKYVDKSGPYARIDGVEIGTIRELVNTGINEWTVNIQTLAYPL
jgi:hypothetical protein